MSKKILIGKPYGTQIRAKLKCSSVKKHWRGVYGLYSKGHARSNTGHTGVTELSLCPWLCHSSMENFLHARTFTFCANEIYMIFLCHDSISPEKKKNKTTNNSLPNFCIRFVYKIMIQYVSFKKKTYLISSVLEYSWRLNSNSWEQVGVESMSFLKSRFSFSSVYHSCFFSDTKVQCYITHRDEICYK